MDEKKYKVSAPSGSTIISIPYKPNTENVFTEKELREYAMQLIHDPSWTDSWKEKVSKDPIESVIEWLSSAGYQINEL